MSVFSVPVTAQSRLNILEILEFLDGTFTETVLFKVLKKIESCYLPVARQSVILETEKIKVIWKYHPHLFFAAISSFQSFDTCWILYSKCLGEGSSEFCSSTGKISSESIDWTPSIKVSRLETYESIFKVDRSRKIGSHPLKVDSKVDYPRCRIPLLWKRKTKVHLHIMSPAHEFGWLCLQTDRIRLCNQQTN